MVAGLLRGKPYTCQALRPVKSKEVESLEEYVFDISRADQIFDALLKDEQLKLSNGDNIPLGNELKGKNYCK